MARLSPMAHIRNHNFWRAVAQCLAGNIAGGVADLWCLSVPGLRRDWPGLLYLVVVVLVSLMGGPRPVTPGRHHRQSVPKLSTLLSSTFALSGLVHRVNQAFDDISATAAVQVHR